MFIKNENSRPLKTCSLKAKKYPLFEQNLDSLPFIQLLESTSFNCLMMFFGAFLETHSVLTTAD